MEVEFTVLGPPRGKERPRICRKNGKSMSYTPWQTVKYEKLIKASYKSVSKKRIDANIPIEIEILAFFDVPRRAIKTNRFNMLSGQILPTKKPDSDNIIKVVCDALNSLAYEDDKQICNVKFKKVYGEIPRLEIKIKQIMEEQTDEEN